MKVNQVKCWFLRRGERGVPGENLSVQSREQTNSTHIWRRVRESNPGHIGGRRVLSPLRHPCTLHPTLGRRVVPCRALINKAARVTLEVRCLPFISASLSWNIRLRADFWVLPYVKIWAGHLICKKALKISQINEASWGAGMAQWWEHSPPTNVARVRFPDPQSYVGWVCWFSTLHREVFYGYSGFPSHQKPTFDLICVNC